MKNKCCGSVDSEAFSVSFTRIGVMLMCLLRCKSCNRFAYEFGLTQKTAKKDAFEKLQEAYIDE